MRNTLEILAPYTKIQLDRQNHANHYRRGVIGHERRHAKAVDALGMSLGIVDANPQGGGVEGITTSGFTDLAKHAVAAAASIAAGEEGTDGDRGIINAIENVTEGRVTLGRSIAVANSIAAGENEATVKTEIAIIDAEYDGRLVGNGQLRSIERQADFENRQVIKERKEAKNILFDASSGKYSDEVVLAAYEVVYTPFSDN